MILLIIFILFSYLIGAVPFALLIARTRGVDIRTVGSRNVGATNVFRSVDKRLGVLTFTCDVLKGFLPAILFPLWATAGIENPQNAGLLYGCAAIAGHNWPIYLQLKGGKGVATSAGVLLGVAPLAVAVGLAVWLTFFAVFRYVSFASIMAAAGVPIAAWFLHGTTNRVLPAVMTVLGLLVIWRHRSNIERLLNGTEKQFRKELSRKDAEEEQ